MKQFIELINSDFDILVSIYSYSFKKFGIKKYPLIISSMRAINKKKEQKKLLSLIKNTKYFENKNIKKAMCELREYWA